MAFYIMNNALLRVISKTEYGLWLKHLNIWNDFVPKLIIYSIKKASEKDLPVTLVTFFWVTNIVLHTFWALLSVTRVFFGKAASDTRIYIGHGVIIANTIATSFLKNITHEGLQGVNKRMPPLKVAV